MRERMARLGTALLVFAVAGCGARDSGEPTVNVSGAGEASANAPLAPSSSGSSVPTPAPKGTAPPKLGQKPAPAPATAAPPPPPANVDPCKSRHLTIRVIHQPSADPAAMIALVAITNASASSCALSGWPTVTLTRSGADVGVPTTNVNEPRAPIGIVLRGTRSAFAGLRWKACAPIAISCRTGTGLRIAAPGAGPIQAQLLGFPSKRLRMSALEIGSVQPTTTNILSW